VDDGACDLQKQRLFAVRIEGEREGPVAQWHSQFLRSGPFESTTWRALLEGKEGDEMQPRPHIPHIRAAATRGDFSISTDPARLDYDLIYRYLSEESYWARGMQRERLERALAHSLCFGIYDERSAAQVGFARLVTDFATFAYLADVFVLSS